ncbi:MAG: Na+/H+ antiporter NhaA [Bdellovibrionaceae bacterium]|nr:Na+/H+ antiporter NhaA [Pseudobdellovibrionaceae bacterium]
MASSKNKFSFLKNILKNFSSTEASSSLILLFCAGLALYMANSTQWQELYKTIVHYPLSLNLGSYSIKANFHYIINEGLMSLFFFVVGMEIKRELVEGELSSPKKASLPLIAAIGGSLVPALIFYFFNQGLTTEKGWGIPMATDIAFAVGVLSLLSHKVPFSLKIFLLSIAIIDDIIAVLVIALFYSDSTSGPFLALVLILSFSIFLYFKLHLNNKLLLSFLALALWTCLYNSGIHATLSGVILGALIPGKSRWSEKQALDSVKKVFSKKEETSLSELKNLKGMVEDTKSILQRLISLYHPYVSYIIMPLFAFANAGILIKGVVFIDWIQAPVSLGIILGLFVGKPLGITLFSYFACFTKLSQKPEDISWIQITAVSFLAGIGFTMSLFILNLGLGTDHPAYSFAKISIIFASFAAAVVGLVLLGFGKTVPLKQRKNPV